jgi:hypothetical protein
MDGSQVGHAYWALNALEKIVHYCEKDVVAVTELFLKLQQYQVPENLKITYETLPIDQKQD